MKKVFSILIFLLFGINGFSQKPTDSIHLFVEKQASFPGGVEEMYKYLYRNIKYPPELISEKTEGIVYTSFVVNKDGSLSEIEVLRGLQTKIDNEAIRVIASMPEWVPAKNGEENVRWKTNLPLKFVVPAPSTDTLKIYPEADVMPMFPGGVDALYQYLYDSVRLPEDFDIELLHRTTVEFIVERNGVVTNTKISDSCHYSCDKEALRLVSAMPLLTPGIINDSPVRVLLNLPVTFDRPGDIFTLVETMPEYPGGMQELLNFIGENLIYPEGAKRKNIQGRVYINFIVEGDGTVTSAKVLNGIGGGCDEEAVKVVNKMPKWIPGKQKGKPVRVSYNLPLKFTLVNSPY